MRKCETVNASERIQSLIINPLITLYSDPNLYTVLSLISAPGACKIQMKNLNISLFLISVLFGGTIYKIKFLLKYETMRVKNNEIYD